MVDKEKRVLKYGPGPRFVHWTHTISFILLLLTGLVQYTTWFSWLAPVFGGVSGANLIHRIMAIIFVGVPLIGLILRPGSFINWMKEALTWTKDDVKFMLLFPFEFIGLPVGLPPQGRINAGQKFNSLLFPTMCALIAISGFIMWFAGSFPAGLVRLAYLVHDVAWIITAAQVINHAYLGSLHPNSGESFSAMFGDGTVRAAWARHHHKKWYDEVYGDR